ncbi:MAG: DUF4406 domain-containing protein [Kluyvera sp.]|uniref:DUF4406 domain-containing protein n=1 Tax=Kluyvera sp. TaxID=1538228 RepID=UPI003A863B09
MPKIYIAGPMTGHFDYNRPSFFRAEALLRVEGHIVLNPAALPGGLSQREYMLICTAMVHCADVLHMLDGWMHSEGARAEFALARKLGLRIEYQTALNPEAEGVQYAAE